MPGAVYAQSCSLCRDTTAGSAPKMREGLKRGILVLGGAAGMVFAVILIAARMARVSETEEATSEPVSESQ